MSNGSLDFLNMIKNQSAPLKETRARTLARSDSSDNRSGRIPSGTKQLIAVIDTETNWHDQVMSIGVALADASDYKCIDKRYYVLAPECFVGGIYSGVMNYREVRGIQGSREDSLKEICSYLDANNVKKILAYNAKFDYGHLPELSSFDWYDIMRLAAYKQYNKSIPETMECCKTGRLKTNYGVEPIMRMLSGDRSYREVHNAVYDAVDELKFIELLGHPVEMYECGLI